MNAETTGTAVLRDAGWIMTPFNYPLSTIPPPQATSRIWGGMEEFVFGKQVAPAQQQQLDSETHLVLLAESFEKYGEVWKKLAEK